MRTSILALILSCAAVVAVEPDRTPLPIQDQVRDKLFPALQLLSGNREVSGLAIRKDPRTAWTPEELRDAEAQLRALFRGHASVRELVSRQLRRSGVMQLRVSLSDEDLLAATWKEAAQGISRIIEVYQFGQPPRYPAIDSPSADVKSPGYLRLLQTAAAIRDEEAVPGEPFFAASVRYALALLEINRRDEAGRFEPMDQGENRAALLRAKTVRWSDYPYPVLVVPGAGSDRPGVPLSPMGKLRTRLAAKRLHDRKAPFIIVTGGYVHPNQTPFCEALEMKKVLIAEFGVPPDAIIIDPHARHTTTNLRNAARLLYRYGFPFDKASFIVTDPGQSAYIEDAGFAARCRRELGYLPYRDLKRVSQFDLEFQPSLESLHVDPLDPLDP